MIKLKQTERKLRYHANYAIFIVSYNGACLTLITFCNLQKQDISICDINVSLSGVPDLCDRTRILRCGDLPDCIWVFFDFVWFLFIHHNIHFYFELSTFCYILDIYLLQNMNSVKYLLFYIKLLNYSFCNMFGSVLECNWLTGVSLLWTRRAMANQGKIGLVWK